MEKIEIRVIGKENADDIRIKNEPFALFGRMIPRYEGGKWSYSVEKTEEQWDIFPDENYDFEAMEKDIETYGLYTYEEMSELVELPEAMFDAAGGKYLKVSIGKGNMTEADLAAMITRYTKYF
jgi:hypothetical protein